MRLLLLGLLLLVGCAPQRNFPVPTNCEQLITVRSIGGIQVLIDTLERIDQRWQPIHRDWPGTIGRNGFATPTLKREGDGCTPMGVYAIEQAFGYGDTCDTRLRYRPARMDDFWIDDAQSTDYNRWVRGDVPTISHERMRRDDDLYEFGAVIEYNTKPIVPAKGSAIFVHVWKGPNQPTAGCVALSKEHVVELLRWLDVEKHPHIILGEIERPLAPTSPKGDNHPEPGTAPPEDHHEPR